MMAKSLLTDCSDCQVRRRGDERSQGAGQGRGGSTLVQTRHRGHPAGGQRPVHLPASCRGPRRGHRHCPRAAGDRGPGRPRGRSVSHFPG